MARLAKTSAGTSSGSAIPSARTVRRGRAEAAVQAFEDEVPGGVDLVAPAVVLHEQVKRARREHGGLCARGELRADGVGPDCRGNVAVQARRKAVAIERALEDASDGLAAL